MLSFVLDFNLIDSFDLTKITVLDFVLDSFDLTKITVLDFVLDSLI